jgi:sec-independent protein translocase protein TatA
MGTFSIWHWLIVLVIVLVLFGGGGKISKLMGDLGKGLKSFKKNIKEESSGDTNGEAETDLDKAITSDESKKSMDSNSSDNKDRAANG